MNKEIFINKQRLRRRARVRAKIFGTSKKPRFSVYRSLKHFYIQLVDDKSGKTLVSAKDIEIKEKGKKAEIAFKVGELISVKAIKLGITEVVFDKSHFKYHGRIKSAAEGARKGGLKF